MKKSVKKAVKPATTKKVANMKLAVATNLAEIAKSGEKVIKPGKYNPDHFIVTTGKIPRVTHNQERVLDFNKKTVREALESRRYAYQDIKYDVDRGFIEIVEKLSK
tara:strand:- start:355 stop:672 length:318 start_codon:yes stop_codon:yes gene_type:complete